MKDKRKFKRFEMHVPARIELPDQAGGEVKLDLETNDLSAEGMFLRSGKPIPEGSRVKVEIALHFEELETPADPEGTLLISSTGSVVRSGPEGVAIRFNNDYEFKACLELMEKKKKNKRENPLESVPKNKK